MKPGDLKTGSGMQVALEPKLVEHAVSRAIFGKRKLEAELHRTLDPLYAMAPDHEREAGFRDAYAKFFSRLGLADVLVALLEERPIIGERVHQILIREAPTANRESAELFVRKGSGAVDRENRTLVIGVSVDGLMSGKQTIAKMRRELLHVADMLDEDFQYRREEIEARPSRRNIIYDRYRVLWDIYVHGRLDREGRGEEGSDAWLRALFAKVFGENSDDASHAAFDRIHESTRLTHGQLFGWASAPATLLGKHGGMEVETGPRPGEECPLCGFPTFDWGERELLDDESIRSAIGQSYADWKVEDGACRQCVEIYAIVAGRRLPIPCRNGTG